MKFYLKKCENSTHFWTQDKMKKLKLWKILNMFIKGVPKKINFRKI